MNNFNAILTDRDGFKRGVIIDVDYNVVIDAAYKQANHQYTTLHYDMLDSIRDYVNLYYTNWKFLDFEVYGGKYSMLNDPNKTVICTYRYYYSSCFTTIFNYINNGRVLVNRTVI